MSRDMTAEAVELTKQVHRALGLSDSYLNTVDMGVPGHFACFKYSTTQAAFKIIRGALTEAISCNSASLDVQSPHPIRECTMTQAMKFATPGAKGKERFITAWVVAYANDPTKFDPVFTVNVQVDDGGRVATAQMQLESFTKEEIIDAWDNKQTYVAEIILDQDVPVPLDNLYVTQEMLDKYRQADPLTDHELEALLAYYQRIENAFLGNAIPAEYKLMLADVWDKVARLTEYRNARLRDRNRRKS